MNAACVVGIDPGLDGALAVLRGEELSLFVTPTLDCKGGKRTFDLPRMREMLVHAKPSLVVIEKVGVMPKQGLVSGFNFGVGFGIWLGLLAGLGIPCELALPQKWKAAILSGSKKDKQAAIEYVQRRFPGVSLLATPRSRKPHDGMADAATLAMYARQLLNGKAD